MPDPTETATPTAPDPGAPLPAGLRAQVRQMHLAVLLFFAVDSALLTGFAWAGSVPWHVGWIYGVAGCSVSALLMLRFWRRGARVGDINPMTLALTLWTGAVMLATLGLAPQVGGFTLMSMLTVLAFSAVQLNTRQLLPLCAALAVGSIGVLTVADATAGIPTGSLAERVLAGVWLAWLMVKITAHHVAGTRLRAMVSRANAKLADALQALERVAATDELTALPNRRAILAQLGQALAGAGGAAHDQVAVVLLDIDSFKAINDRHGHDVGDRVLRTFGQIVARCLRPSDRVGRSGGEEFLLVLQQVRDAAAAADAADRVRAGVQAHDWSGAAAGLAVTVSAGVAVVEDGEDGGAAIRRADTALYAAKRGGRNRVVLAEVRGVEDGAAG